MSKEEFSIMPANLRYSTERTPTYCHRHEVFFGTANRWKSIRDGLVVFLTPEMHNASNKGVHFNREFDLYLKRIGQQTWMDYYGKTVNDFIREYGKNYIYDNAEHCISCGEIIPEGRIMCPYCEVKM